jgi:hypothetical protein
MGIVEYRIQIVLEPRKLPISKNRDDGWMVDHLVLPKEENGDDLWTSDVRISLSDSSHYAQNMPELLRTGELELFVLVAEMYTVGGLVIENRLGTNSRVGTWEVDLPSWVLFQKLEYLES